MVIMLLAILAGIALPRVVDSVQLAAERAWTSQLLVYIAAVERCYAETGDFPSDSDTGTFPAELETYLREGTWTEETPIGGAWDFERDDNGVHAAVGAHFKSVSNASTDVLARIDERVDDGDPNSGALRLIGPKRFYFVFE